MSKVNNSLDYDKNIEPLSEESLPDDISLSNYASEEDEPIDIYIKLDEKPEALKEFEEKKLQNIKQAFIDAKKLVSNIEDDSDSSEEINDIFKNLKVNNLQVNNTNNK